MTPFICRVGIKKLFAHSVLVLMALSMVPSNFVKGPIRTKAAKGRTYNCPSKQILILVYSVIINIIILYLLYIQY